MLCKVIFSDMMALIKKTHSDYYSHFRKEKLLSTINTSLPNLADRAIERGSILGVLNMLEEIKSELHELKENYKLERETDQLMNEKRIENIKEEVLNFFLRSSTLIITRMKKNWMSIGKKLSYLIENMHL